MLCPYKTASFGIDLIGASYAFLWEPAINISTEWQAIHRGHCQGQTEEVKVIRLFTYGTFDEYRENKATEKIIPEVALWSQHSLVQTVMLRLLRANDGVEYEFEELKEPEVLRKAARLVVQSLSGQQTPRREDGPHITHDLEGTTPSSN